jgi:hypothetical protein
MCPTENCKNAVTLKGFMCCSFSCQLEHRENERHRKQVPGPPSGFIGVYGRLHGTPKVLKWRFKLRSQDVGFFCTKEEAAAAYDEAARKLFGPSAKCNFENESAAQSRAKAAISEWEKQTGRKWEKQTGYRGVCKNGHKWQARLHLGFHDTKDEACAAYGRAACLLQNDDSTASDAGHSSGPSSGAMGFRSLKNRARGKAPRSLTRGVSLGKNKSDAGKWQARMSLGSFRTKEEAAAAYDAAARKCQGREAILNFESTEVANSEMAEAVAKCARAQQAHQLLLGVPTQLRVVTSDQ